MIGRAASSGRSCWRAVRSLVALTACVYTAAVPLGGCSPDSFGIPSDPEERREELFAAAKHGTTGRVEALLGAGAEAGTRDLLGWTPLHYAINRWRSPDYREPRPAEMLMAASGVDVTSAANDGTTPIQLAARHGAVEILDRLLERGARLDGRDRDGITLLMEAAKSGKLEMVGHLIELGADVNERLPGGGTALFVAISSRNPDTVRSLIEAGAEVGGNEKAADPIIFAAALQVEEVVELLIAAGANVNAVNRNNGLTPLHRAVTSGAGMVKLLLEAGARPGVSNQEGHTALDLARELGDRDTIDLLVASSS